ncbi:MAG: flagellar hook protein FlgE, partial [Gammaproteobacteria bacterium]|nr:flagellar hook protein FlgE [Gammaproteobacteria bacterium]
MPFRIAISGLNSASADLSVTGNNIANANTYGFKSSRAEFAEVFAAGGQTGGGVRLTRVAQTFSQGNVDFTNNPLDLAIGGEGFFVVNDGGARAYTRAGNFSVDRDGFVVDSQGSRLKSYPPAGKDAFNTGLLSDLQITTGSNAPRQTTSVDIGVNFPAAAPQPAQPVFDPSDPSSYNHTTSTTVYDSLGTPHVTTFYFIKDAAANTWLTETYMDGNQVGTAQTLEFNSSGEIVVPAGGRLTLAPYATGNGSEDINVELEYGTTTQFGEEFAVNSLNQDGFTTGRLAGLDIGPTGVISARFTNGQTTPLGKVALAKFANPNGLAERGDTSWGESFQSGNVILGEAGSSSFGLIQSGALEAS